MLYTRTKLVPHFTILSSILSSTHEIPYLKAKQTAPKALELVRICWWWNWRSLRLNPNHPFRQILPIWSFGCWHWKASVSEPVRGSDSTPKETLTSASFLTSALKASPWTGSWGPWNTKMSISVIYCIFISLVIVIRSLDASFSSAVCSRRSRWNCMCPFWMRCFIILKT